MQTKVFQYCTGYRATCSNVILSESTLSAIPLSTFSCLSRATFEVGEHFGAESIDLCALSLLSSDS